MGSGHHWQVCAFYLWTGRNLPRTIGVMRANNYRGGMIGVVVLETLRQIEAELGGIKIQEFFDLILGTK